MVKHFCDRCNREVGSRNHQLYLTNPNGSRLLSQDLCDDCAKKIINSK